VSRFGVFDEVVRGGGAGSQSAPAGDGVDVPDRVALADGAVLPGACTVVLYVNESDMQKRLRQVMERKREVEPREADSKSQDSKSGARREAELRNSSSGNQEASYRPGSGSV